MTLRPSPSVRSAIEVAVLDGYDPEIDEPGDDPYRAIRESWDGERLTVADASALRLALCELSNAHDDIAVHPPRGTDPSEIAFARRVVRGLDTLMSSLREVARV